MPTVFIVIQQNDNPDRDVIGSRDDLQLDIPVVLTNKNDSGVSAWLWQIVDKPSASTAALSTPTHSVSGFTPDVVGTYLLRLTINNGAMANTAGAAVKTPNLHIRIPAASESDEFDTFRGWAGAVDDAFQKIDDGYSGGGGGGTLQEAYDLGGGDIIVNTIQLLHSGAATEGLVNNGLSTSSTLNAITGLAGVRYAVGTSQAAYKSTVDGTWSAFSGIPSDGSNPDYTAVLLYFSESDGNQNIIIIGTSNGKVYLGPASGGIAALAGFNTLTMPFAYPVAGFFFANSFAEITYIYTDDPTGPLYVWEPSFTSQIVNLTEFGLSPFGQKITGISVYNDKTYISTSNGSASKIWQSGSSLVEFSVVSSGNPVLHAIATWQGKLYAVGNSGTILSSSNGTSWSTQTSGTSLTLRSISASDSGAIYISGGDEATSVILKSVSDGIWTTLNTSAAASTLVSIFEDPGDFTIRVVGDQHAFAYATIPATGGHLTVSGAALFESGLDAYGKKITTLGQPTDYTDATTKAYVDQVANPFDITDFDNGVGTLVEVGFEVVNPSFTASYNRPAAVVTLDDGSGDPFPVSLTLPATTFHFGLSPLDPKTYVNATINDFQTWDLTARENLIGVEGPNTTASTQITWTANVYYGTNVAFTPPTETLTDGNFEGAITPWNPQAANGGSASKANAILIPVDGVITNGDFEGGNTIGWTTTVLTLPGDGETAGVAQTTTQFAHSGTHSLLVGAPGDVTFNNDVSISQNFTVPVGGRLSFWVRTSAPDSIDYDWFQGHIRTANGTTVLVDLFAGLPGQHRSTPTGGNQPPPTGEIGPVYYSTFAQDLPWTQVIADLSSYAGQEVQLFFLAEDDGFFGQARPTQLFIDDIQIVASVSGNNSPHGGSFFGLVTADGTAGSIGTLTQTVDIPAEGATFTGYYRASGSDSPGTGYSTQILADTPFAYWKLDEAFGSSVAADSSGNNRDASASSNGPGWQFGLSGVINDGGTAGGQISFNQSPDIGFNSSLGIDWNTPWSYSYGVRTSSNLNGNAGIYMGTSSFNSGAFRSWVNSNGTLYVGTADVQILFTNPGVIMSGDNHVVAITCDGTNLTAYIDGILVDGPTPHGQSPIGTWDLILFGAISGALRGAFDNFALFTTQLDSGRVEAQYAAAGLGDGSTQGIFVYDDSNTNILETVFAGNVNTEPGAWVPFSVDLGNYAGQIVNIVAKATTDGYVGPRQLSVDDFHITSGISPTTYLGTLTSHLQTSFIVQATDVVVSASDGYFVAVIPTTYEALYENFIDVETGLPIGMVKTSAGFVVTNIYNIDIPYDFWRSEYPHLGVITFKIMNEAGK